MTDKWFIVRKRYVPSVWTCHTFWLWPVNEYFGVKDVGLILSVWNKGYYWAIHEEQKARIELGNAVAQKIINEAKDLKSFRQKGIDAGEEVTAFCREFANRSDGTNLKEVVNFLNELEIKYSEIMKHNMHYWVMGAPIIQEMVKTELSYLKQNEAEEVLHTMLVPKEISYSQKIDIELSNLKREQVPDFCKKYFWFPYEYVGPEIWDEKKVIQMIENKVEAKTYDLESIKSSQEECIKKYNLSESTVNLFEILQTLALMQDDRKRYNSEICYYLNGVVFANVAKMLDIPREEALYLNQELLESYETDPELFKKRLKERAEMLVEITEDGKSRWYEGEEKAKKILSDLGIQLEADASAKEIKGQIGNKGKATGRVRVLRTSQVSDFNDGDVIVTGMTTPDFAPLMKKASAIVTDEGGITCHAAIVSRELNIPCVIGTKHATEILKDGDMVEVDAEKGIVTIIN
jgi:phosphohistidine swiveling domain-containing protein